MISLTDRIFLFSFLMSPYLNCLVLHRNLSFYKFLNYFCLINNMLLEQFSVQIEKYKKNLEVGRSCGKIQIEHKYKIAQPNKPHITK